jgi:hypothetical protein
MANICGQCGESFIRAYSAQKFCSRKCSGASRRLTPEQRREYQRNWAKRNPEKLKVSRTKWDVKHRATRILKQKEYNALPHVKAALKIHVSEYRSNPAKSLRRLANGCVARAKKFDIPFDIGLREFLFSNPVSNCCCCGVAFDFQAYTGRKDRSPSLDRLQPDAGYTIENTRVICWRCNRIKLDATLKEIENLVAYMKKNQSNKTVAA